MIKVDGFGVAWNPILYTIRWGAEGYRQFSSSKPLYSSSLVPNESWFFLQCRAENSTSNEVGNRGSELLKPRPKVFQKEIAATTNIIATPKLFPSAFTLNSRAKLARVRLLLAGGGTEIAEWDFSHPTDATVRNFHTHKRNPVSWERITPHPVGTVHWPICSNSRIPRRLDEYWIERSSFPFFHPPLADCPSIKLKM